MSLRLIRYAPHGLLAVLLLAGVLVLTSRDAPGDNPFGTWEIHRR